MNFVAAGFLRSFYLRYFAKPASDRMLYRLIEKQQPQKILEVGLGNGQRTEQLLQMVFRHHAPSEVQYTGFDLFETHPDRAQEMTLMGTYQRFKKLGCQVQLIPGDPASGFARMANRLPGNQLILLNADLEMDLTPEAWFYVPRMLAEEVVIFREELLAPDQKKWCKISRHQIEQLASQYQSQRRESQQRESQQRESQQRESQQQRRAA